MDIIGFFFSEMYYTAKAAKTEGFLFALKDVEHEKLLNDISNINDK